MWTRWVMMGLALVLGAAQAEATKLKDCKQACAAQIAACAAACDPYGTLDSACNKAVLKRCKKEGVETCAPATTTSTSTTSSTVGGGSTTTSTVASLCDTFCSIVQANCTGGNQVYADANACQTACAQFPTNGNPGDTSGDTVQCRIYHAQAAAGSPVVHCPHTQPVSATCHN
jgi:hypothetical protein